MYFLQVVKNQLILQIILGLLISISLFYISPSLSAQTIFLGELFIKALKAVAPILVLVLVAAAIANQTGQAKGKMKPIIIMYLIGTFSAAIIAVSISFLFPVNLDILAQKTSAQAPESIKQIFLGILFKLVDNPISALIEGNYLGLIIWGCGLGFTLKQASESTRRVFSDVSDCICQLVQWIIRFAPLGIIGITAKTLNQGGMAGLMNYFNLLMVLLLSMALFGLVFNPFLVFMKTRKNPYPLLWHCLKYSGLTAFFTRSSAANIPVNLALCEKLNLDKDIYSVSIPLGATMNTAGAAITISTLTLATVYSLGIPVDFFASFLLVSVAAISACGASGIAGGSLLLIPLSCSLFGISDDIAMNIVAIGFLIGIVQDAVETALNSSTDVYYTAAVCSQN